MSDKRCAKCKELKSVVRFNKNKATKDELTSICKECNSTTLRNWKKANPEKVRENGRRRYLSGKEYVVYMIETPDGDYIGSTVKGLAKRKSEHLSSLRKGIHDSSNLQIVFDIYGEDALRFIELEVVKLRYMLRIREQYHLEQCLKPLNVNRATYKDSKTEISSLYNKLRKRYHSKSGMYLNKKTCADLELFISELLSD